MKAYKERMAALKIQKVYRGVLGRRRALLLRMKRRLMRTTQVLVTTCANASFTEQERSVQLKIMVFGDAADALYR